MPHESPSFEAEIKALQFDLNLLPPDVLLAMRQAKPHADIGERGVVYQNYFAVDDRAVLDNVVDALNKANVPFGSDAEQAALANIQNAREFRYLVKPRQNVYQLTIKGDARHEGISRPQLETPESHSDKVMAVVFDLGLLTQVRWQVRKLWHDIYADIGGKRRKVEHDIYASHDGLMVVETEVEAADEAGSVAELRQLVDSGALPPYFQHDVTHRPDLKAARIAAHGLPEDIMAMQSRVAENSRAMIREMLKSHKIMFFNI